MTDRWTRKPLFLSTRLQRMCVCVRARLHTPSRDSKRREFARSMEVKFFTVSTCWRFWPANVGYSRRWASDDILARRGSIRNLGITLCTFHLASRIFPLTALKFFRARVSCSKMAREWRKIFIYICACLNKYS